MAKSLVFLAVAAVQFMVLVQSFPKNSKEDFFAWHYLKDYHYLSDEKDGVHDMKTGLEMFQKFFQLPVTGELDAATIAAMHKPRCGVQDVHQETKGREKRYLVSAPWSKNSLTYVFESYTADLSRNQQERVIALAFALWANVSNLSFTMGSDPASADLKISFVKGDHTCSMPFDGPGSILAHAFFPEIGNLHFDDDEDFTDGQTSGTNLLAVAAHEIGHLLGVEHSSNQGAVMRSAYTGFNPNFALHQDDVDAIQHLYGGQNKAPETATSNACRDLASTCSKYIKVVPCSAPGMRNFCSKSCGHCGGGQSVVQCTNTLSDSDCEVYKSSGICVSNPAVMKDYCKKTCDLCS